MGHIAFIGIGSNMGDKVRRCEEAISEILKVDRNTLLAKSSFYKTRPVGYTRQDWFVNGVIKIETELEASDLLHSLKAIENHLGRLQTFRWGPRAIDLDILLFDGTCIETPEVKIPHPRIQERQFVLVPLAEIDPDLLHPVLKKTVQRLLEDLKEDQGVERLRDDR
jgi:2-amino-4-hydroxy-6-hydroxymethyldihydropteridine diphosphokinase